MGDWIHAPSSHIAYSQRTIAVFGDSGNKYLDRAAAELFVDSEKEISKVTHIDTKDYRWKQRHGRAHKKFDAPPIGRLDIVGTEKDYPSRLQMAWIPEVSDGKWGVEPHNHEECGYFWLPWGNGNETAIVGLGNSEFDDEPEKVIELAYPNMIYIASREYSAVRSNKPEMDIYVAVLRLHPALVDDFKEEWMFSLAEGAE